MFSEGQMKRESSTSVGVIGLVILLAVFFSLGHLSWAWDPSSTWWARAWGPTIALPPNPYTLSGTIRFP